MASSSTYPTTVSIPTFTVTFYTDLGHGVVTADGTTKTDQATGIYPGGKCVHLLASPLSGCSFTSWETGGVSVDDQLASDTYMTDSCSYLPSLDGVVPSGSLEESVPRPLMASIPIKTSSPL
jgi:hypothetical protein